MKHFWKKCFWATAENCYISTTISCSLRQSPRHTSRRLPSSFLPLRSQHKGQFSKPLPPINPKLIPYPLFTYRDWPTSLHAGPTSLHALHSVVQPWTQRARKQKGQAQRTGNWGLTNPQLRSKNWGLTHPQLRSKKLGPDQPAVEK
jgi:hypothetical protein